MSEYTKNLEQQNEELRKKLAVAEEFIDWHNKRLATKFFFTYSVLYTYTENGRKYEKTLDVSRETLKYIYEMRESKFLTNVAALHCLKGKNSKVSVSVAAWRKSEVIDFRYLLDFEYNDIR